MLLMDSYYVRIIGGNLDSLDRE